MLLFSLKMQRLDSDATVARSDVCLLDPEQDGGTQDQGSHILGSGNTILQYFCRVILSKLWFRPHFHDDIVFEDCIIHREAKPN